jgi:hypothetical protein
MPVVRLEGEIDEDIIENIENAKNYLNDFKYEEIQEIIKDNTGKKTRYLTLHTPKIHTLTLHKRKTRPLTP